MVACLPNAARFRQGRRIEPAVSATLAAIARMGFVRSGCRGKPLSVETGQAAGMMFPSQGCALD